MALGRGLGAPRKGPKTSDLGSKTPILGGLGIPQIPHFWRSWVLRSWHPCPQIPNTYGLRVPSTYLHGLYARILCAMSSVHVLSTSLRVLST